MADQVAGAPEVALINESQVAVATRRDDRRIEVDQVRVIGRVSLRAADAVRIVTRIAGGVFATYVFVVLAEALVVQYVALAVAVVAELVGAGAVLRVVGDFVAIHQDRLERRTVWPFRSRATGALRRTRVVAITAGDYRLLGQRWNKARYVTVASDRADGMERRVGRLNLEAKVCLFMLPQRAGRRLVGTIAVTAQADFVGFCSGLDPGPGDIHAANVGGRGARDSSRIRRMRIVAIDALDVTRIDNSRLDRIVDAGCIGNTVAECPV